MTSTMITRSVTANPVNPISPAAIPSKDMSARPPVFREDGTGGDPDEAKGATEAAPLYAWLLLARLRNQLRHFVNKDARTGRSILICEKDAHRKGGTTPDNARRHPSGHLPADQRSELAGHLLKLGGLLRG